MFKGKSAVVRNRRRMAQAIVEALESRQLLSGTEYVVNSLSDTVASDNALTLREAIQAANTNAAVNEAPAGSSTDADIIRFDPALFAARPATIQLDGAELLITGATLIQGPGPDLLSIDARGLSGVLSIDSPATVDLSGVTIRGGAYSVIYHGANYGGYGILVEAGTLRLTNAIVSDNGNNGVYVAEGGTLDVLHVNVRGNDGSGIYSYGAVTIEDSAIVNNRVGIGNIGTADSGTVTLINVTVAGNTTLGVLNDRTMTMTNVTVTANKVGIQDQGSLTIQNSIVAGNFDPETAASFDIRSPSASYSFAPGTDYNLFGVLDESHAASAGTHSRSGTPEAPLDPGLGPMTTIYGLPVFPLLPGSLAINAGSNALAVDAAGNALNTDQVGNQRIIGGIVDVGAYEYAACSSQAGMIQGSVFEDINGNAMRDSGEPGLAQWRVYIDANGNGTFDEGEPTAVSDLAGRYELAGLAEGTYWLRQVPQDKWAPSLGANGFNVTIAAGQILSIDCGQMYLPAIIGSVFEDLNGNGIRDRGEPGLGGCRLYIDANGDGNLSPGEPSTVSDVAGAYQFSDLIAGTYRVREVTPAGFAPTSGAGGVIATVRPGRNAYCVDFGNVRVGSISGQVFLDSNANRRLDRNEAILRKWRVFIDSDNDGVLDKREASVLTNARGRFAFKSLPVGRYIVRVASKRGYRATTSRTGGHAVKLAAGKMIQVRDLGQKR